MPGTRGIAGAWAEVSA